MTELSDQQRFYKKRQNGKRPQLCPESRCTPLALLADSGYDPTVHEPGRSFFCWGLMERPVTFVYDGVEHTNDRNACTYTPLKGLIRMQENDADWEALASMYAVARSIANERPKP